MGSWSEQHLCPSGCFCSAMQRSLGGTVFIKVFVGCSCSSCLALYFLLKALAFQTPPSWNFQWPSIRWQGGGGDIFWMYTTIHRILLMMWQIAMWNTRNCSYFWCFLLPSATVMKTSKQQIKWIIWNRPLAECWWNTCLFLILPMLTVAEM